MYRLEKRLEIAQIKFKYFIFVLIIFSQSGNHQNMKMKHNVPFNQELYYYLSV